MGTDILISRLGVKARKFCFLIAHVIMIYITWLMFEGSWGQMMVNVNTSAAVSGISMSYLYLAGVVFAVSTFLILIREIFLLFTGKISNEDLMSIGNVEEVIDSMLPQQDTSNTNTQQPHKK